MSREAMKHTPGPWFQGTGNYEYCVYDKRVWINQDGSSGGETPNLVVVVSPEDAIADARLIAAAPELLDALERYVHHFGDPLKCARTAIAKATGEKA